MTDLAITLMKKTLQPKTILEARPHNNDKQNTDL
jgi:hypothetical protein